MSDVGFSDEHADELAAVQLDGEILQRMDEQYRPGDVIEAESYLIAHLSLGHPLRDWVEVRPGGPPGDDHYYVWLGLAGRDLVVSQRAVRDAEQALTEARETRQAAVENAARVGLTPYRIAQITGLSQPGVAKILARE